jgi:hypothetical protein
MQTTASHRMGSDDSDLTYLYNNLRLRKNSRDETINGTFFYNLRFGYFPRQQAGGTYIIRPSASLQRAKHEISDVPM